MKRVALVVHASRPVAVEMASALSRWLAARGHEALVCEEEAAAAGLSHLAAPAADMAGVDLAVSLGGDGTMLRAVAMVVRAGVPVLGVNLGSLGYLAALEPDDLFDGMQRVLDGSATIEERALVEVAVAGSAADPALALNEAVVEKASAGRTVRLNVAINGRPFARYVADGLIVATPTGSTAYAFSARGPIVSPDVDAFELTPVSPHMAFDRSLVLGPRDSVIIGVEEGSRGVLSVDGREMAVLESGAAIRCALAPERARLAVPHRRDFYDTLASKFALGTP